MFSNGDELQKYIKDDSVEFIDVRFCDLPGIMQHFTLPVAAFDADAAAAGLMFDGSSIRGVQAIHECPTSPRRSWTPSARPRQSR